MWRAARTLPGSSERSLGRRAPRLLRLGARGLRVHAQRAYLEQFPNGVFRALAQNRLAALRAPANAAPAAVGTRVSGGRESSGPAAPGSRPAGGGDVRRQPGAVFRDCAECPVMVVLAGGNLAMGRYEVTVGEYRAFASATGGGGGNDCSYDGDSWWDPGFPQTDRHPVTCVSWDNAQAYVSWLSRTTGVTYRLPTEAEWDRAAAGSQAGCSEARAGRGREPLLEVARGLGGGRVRGAGGFSPVGIGRIRQIRCRETYTLTGCPKKRDHLRARR